MSVFHALCGLVLALGLPLRSLHALSSAEETKEVAVLASAPLGSIFPDNTNSPVVSFKGTTYFVWVHSDNRPKVGMFRNGTFSSQYLSPISGYTIRADGHQNFSLGIDKNGFLHVSGDMHHYPAVDMADYPAEYQNKIAMHWMSSAPESISSFEFVGGDAARTFPSYGFSYMSFQYDQNRELYYVSRVRIHRSGHYSGEMGWAMFRYNAGSGTWSQQGGLAPSSPAALYKSILWEDNAHNLDGTGGNRNFYQGFRSSNSGLRFDFNNRLHIGSSINNDNSKADPTHVVYGYSDDLGASFNKANGAAVASLPMRVDGGSSQGDVVQGPGKYDIFASVAFNRAGVPLLGFAEILDRQYFSYRTFNPSSGAWNPLVRDPNGAYIRAKYLLDANGLLTFMAPSGQYKRASDYGDPGYKSSVGMNNQFVGVDELGLRETNDNIGLSSAQGQINLVRLRLAPLLKPLPAPWAASSIGAVASPVSGEFYGSFTLGSAANGLGAASDDLRYMHQPFTGDVEIKARVTSLSYAHDLSMAGLMIRESLAAGSKMAVAAITYNSGAQMISRASEGALSVTQSLPGYTAVEWLRLQKQGSVVRAYRSDNGTNWQLISTRTLSLGASLQVGLFHSSYAAGRPSEARFDNLSVSTVSPTATAIPPSATRTPSRTATATTTAPSTPTLAVTGAATATPKDSPVNTAVNTPPPATSTRTATPTATRTPTPLPTPAATQAAGVQLLHSSTDPALHSGPHHTLALKNTGTTALDLGKLELRYWLDCDCGSEGLQAFVDWAGLMPAGSSLQASISPQAFSGSGQTHALIIRFGSGSLPAGASAEVQFRFNRGNWGAMTQGDDYSYAAHPALSAWTKAAAYLNGARIWGVEPTSSGPINSFSAKDGAPQARAWLPDRLALSIAPNPARNQAQAQLELPQSASMRLVICNLAGECVFRLNLGYQSAGRMQLPLDFRALAQGTYMAWLESVSEAGGITRAGFKLAIQ